MENRTFSMISTSLRFLKERLLTPFLDIIFPRPNISRQLETMSENEFIGKAALCIHTDGTAIPVNIGPHLALLRYRNPHAQAAIRDAKYKKSIRAGILLAGAAFPAISALVAKGAVIVPVPASASRRRARGYNQVEFILDHLPKRATGTLIVRTDLLEKTREALSQTETADRAERKRNLHGCFLVRAPRDVEGKTFIVVDDVLTTGATLDEARRALTAAGAREVITFALAH